MDVCVHICITRICTPEGRRIHRTRVHQGMLITVCLEGMLINQA